MYLCPDPDVDADRTSSYEPAPVSEKSLRKFFVTSFNHSFNFLQLENSNIIIRVATAADTHYAATITDEMASSAKARGTGIAKRSPEYVEQKIQEGKAVIAVTTDDAWVGF